MLELTSDLGITTIGADMSELTSSARQEIITHCTSCGKQLELKFPDMDPRSEQYDNALEIQFHGGYGQFIDPTNEEYRAILCHECAHDLCETVRWIGKLINPFNSHAHRYWKRLPDGSTEDVSWPEDHKGWDLPHIR